jgi:hypothetical protein
MPQLHGSHPAEESLERYIMGALSEQETDNVEDHLLVCEHCRQQLLEAEAFVPIAREAARQLEAERLAAKPPSSFWGSLFDGISLRSAGAFAAAAAVVLVAFLAWRPGQPDAPRQWQTVTLETWRGETAGSVATAGFALSLQLNVLGLPESDLLAEIVDTSGSVVATSRTRPSGGWVEVKHSPGLPAGGYWVRLSAAGTPLREYALIVKRSSD